MSFSPPKKSAQFLKPRKNKVKNPYKPTQASTPKAIRASKWNGSSFSTPYDICSSDVMPSSWDGPSCNTITIITSK